MFSHSTACFTWKMIGFVLHHPGWTREILSVSWSWPLKQIVSLWWAIFIKGAAQELAQYQVQMLDIAQGLHYLHVLTPSIIHGDIKGVRNVHYLGFGSQYCIVEGQHPYHAVFKGLPRRFRARSRKRDSKYGCHICNQHQKSWHFEMAGTWTSQGRS